LKSLFDISYLESNESPTVAVEAPVKAAAASLMTMRPYQDECGRKVLDELKTKQSTLYVMATGLGKTVIFANLAKHFIHHGRVLILAHRQELIFQAQRTIEKVIGQTADIEMADRWDENRSNILISSVQTQGGSRGGRKNRFKPEDFSLVITDEAHHATANGWQSVLEYYKQNKNIKIVGCTATPDRADEEALGQVYDSVAFEYELPDAINDGWLVPLMQRQVWVESLDFSQVRTTAGDLNGADLAAVMEYEKNLHAVADPAFELAANRQTLIFAASVAHAERLCEILNRHRKDCARFVCGMTPDDVRVKMLDDYKNNRFQFLTNCGVATEGFDSPGIQVVVMARPTKSRALYTQMLGRGTRTLAGLVDGLATAQERRAAIAASAKPSCEIIDFVGNTGRHELVSTADILGGKYSADVVAAAKREIAEHDNELCDTEEVLRRAKARLEEEEAKRAEATKRAMIIGKAKWKSSVNRPFVTLGIAVKDRGWDKPATPEQHKLLAQNKFDSENLTSAQAQAMIGEVLRRRHKHLATVKQAAILKNNGLNPDMPFEQAKKVMDIIVSNHWRWPAGMKVPE